MSNIPNFSDQQNNKLELMFGDLPQETEIFVKLPSLGKFYTNKVSDVKIKPIKFEDEKHLSVALKNDQNPVNFILGRFYAKKLKVHQCYYIIQVEFLT